MESLNKTVISKHNKKTVLINIINDKMSGIFAFSANDEYPIGTIVNARITKTVKNIGSSFLRYSEKNDGFINKEIKSESLIPVILKKEPSNEKKALFSDKLSIEGDYCIVRENEINILVSSKIPSEDALNIKKCFSEKFSECNYGITVRTKAYSEENGIKMALKEAEEFINMLNEIHKNSPHRPSYTIFYTPEPEIIKAVKSGIRAGIKEIITDDKEIFELLNDCFNKQALGLFAAKEINIRFYEDNLLPLCKLYSFDAKISEVLSRKINLKSGAYITFDNTEALTAIDVNTSKSASAKSSKEDMFLAINLEACKEIFRQIKLRNISGNILIDFINMETPESYEILKHEIDSLIKQDEVSTKFYGFTGLKLAEISRQKKRSSFYRCYKG